MNAKRSDVEVRELAAEDKSVLRNLTQLCQHEYSEFDGQEVNKHGLFDFDYIDHYWTEPGRHPLIVEVAGKIAGFALVRPCEPETTPSEPAYWLAEFFILRKYRRGGIGSEAAYRVFDMFECQWNVAQTKDNTRALAFWRKVIGQYTSGAFEETRDAAGKTFQRFTSPVRLSPKVIEEI